jgi:hypothetical protein
MAMQTTHKIGKENVGPNVGEITDDVDSTISKLRLMPSKSGYARDRRTCLYMPWSATDTARSLELQEQIIVF